MKIVSFYKIIIICLHELNEELYIASLECFLLYLFLILFPSGVLCYHQTLYYNYIVNNTFYCMLKFFEVFFKKKFLNGVLYLR